MRYIFHDGLYASIKQQDGLWVGQLAFVENTIEFTAETPETLKLAFKEAIISYRALALSQQQVVS